MRRNGWKRRAARVALATVMAALVAGSMTCAGWQRPDGARSSERFVTARDGRLMLDGRRFRFIGVNTYSLASAPTDDPDGYRCGRGFSDAEVNGLFAEVAAMGANVVRFDAYQSFTRGGEDYSRIDAVVAAAARHGVRLVVTLENQWPDCTQGGYKYADWYRDGYRRPYGTYPLSYRDHVARIVRRYRSEPSILMWQLMNEAESRTVLGVDDPEALVAFASDMAALVHRIDPNHLLSLGTIGVDRPGSGGAFYVLLHQVPGIDVVEAHDYGSDGEAMPRDVWLAVLASRSMRKPFFIGEVGVRSPPMPAERRATLIIEKLEAAWHEDVDGVLVWSYRARDGGNMDFDADDPLYRAIRRFTSTRELHRDPP